MWLQLAWAIWVLVALGGVLGVDACVDGRVEGSEQNKSIASWAEYHAKITMHAAAMGGLDRSSIGFIALLEG